MNRTIDERIKEALDSNDPNTRYLGWFLDTFIDAVADADLQLTDYKVPEEWANAIERNKQHERRYRKSQFRDNRISRPT